MKKVSKGIIDDIRKEYQTPPPHSSFSIIDNVLVNLRQLDVLEEIRNLLKDERE
jgi:hypothetical protein